MGHALAAGLKKAGTRRRTISAASGAVTGGTFGLVNSTLSGQRPGTVMRNAFIGATAGAAGCHVSARLGGSTLTARTLSGGIGGAVQTGDLEGFMRGMVAGMIPNHVLPGWQAGYLSNAWAHTLLSVASDGLRGAVIGGRAGARFAMSWGLANNAVGHVFGWLTSRAKPRFDSGAWHYVAPSLPGTKAIVFGDVVSWDTSYYARNPDEYSWAMDHETKGHVQLQAAMNVAYLPVHAISQWLFGGLGGRSFMEYAPFIGKYPYSD
jgi:hypothetical protein